MWIKDYDDEDLNDCYEEDDAYCDICGCILELDGFCPICDRKLCQRLNGN